MTDQQQPAKRDAATVAGQSEGQPAQAMEAMIAARPVHGFRRNMGYRTTVWSERYSEVELRVDHRHDNNQGVVHGGVYAAMLDAAFGGAVAFCGIPGRRRLAVTINLLTTYMASAKQGILTAKGRVIGVEGRIATCAGEVVLDDGTVCATGSATFMYLHGSEQPDGIPAETRKAKP